MIRANKIQVPGSSTVHPSVVVECDEFILGENCYIGPGSKITCKSFIAGDYLYFSSEVEVGRGGCTGPNSNVRIGNHVGVFERTVINPSEEVTIGDDVGIGTECLIWTHGAWLDILSGFPASFGPVSIGNRVWLPARSIVLPNVDIGSDCVIGTNSIINRSIPNGSLAAGNPCKIIKENYYPKQLSLEDKKEIISKVVKEWEKQLNHKNISSVLKIEVQFNGCILLQQVDGTTLINPLNKRLTGFENEVVEDLRDFLRRNGIKIYTGKPFKSIEAHYKVSWNK
jgi:acetyltransferase-like isoleucine patch superfamily enzyme